MSQEIVDRSTSCLCCGAKGFSEEAGVVSPFLARRAFDEGPSIVKLFRCGRCGFAWSQRGLSSGQASSLYEGYRGPAYFAQRHSFEPWYSQAKNDSIGSEEEMIDRRAAMADVLTKVSRMVGTRPEGMILDFGGDRGQMLKDFPDVEKLVFDLSGIACDPWASKIEHLDQFNDRCDLVMACQVLEHVGEPVEFLSELVSLARPGGWIYIEVPFEQWSQGGAQASWRERWITWLVKKPGLLMAIDFLSTASRIVLGRVPAIGFWSLREHLNFFTAESLSELAKRVGIDAVLVTRSASGLAMVAVKH
jgi:SAM-dependent methyltransferase